MDQPMSCQSTDEVLFYIIDDSTNKIARPKVCVAVLGALI
jgi:hypothetical protein